jgi:hypothetical protein
MATGASSPISLMCSRKPFMATNLAWPCMVQKFSVTRLAISVSDERAPAANHTTPNDWHRAPAISTTILTAAQTSGVKTEVSLLGVPESYRHSTRMAREFAQKN